MSAQSVLIIIILQLRYAVRNSSLFFVIECMQEGVIEDRASSSCISIQPNIPVINDNMNVLLKERYVEEHITIYNERRLAEKYVVSLRLTLGQRTEFSCMPGLKSSHSYRSLEVSLVFPFRHQSLN
jgi:hypothetical protein